MTEPDRTALAHVTDHVEGGKALLTTVFRKPVIQALLASWLKQVQALEDATWQVYNAFGLDDAVGAQLDAIGSVVGLAQGDIATDALYRRALRGWILANRSRGDGDTINELVDAVLAGDAFDLEAWQPAAFLVTAAEPVAIGAALLATMLRRAAADGVKAQLVAPLRAGDETFAFSSSDEDLETSATRGFADGGVTADDMTTGGHLVGAWE